MSTGSIVIAIGGNAILNPAMGNPDEQRRMIDKTCLEIAQIIQRGYDVVLTHGNGPQIGNILAMQEECGSVQAQPLDVCGAQTQGMLGYLLKQSLDNRLRESGINRQVAAVLTQVVVDESDPSFDTPTKPIGLYYSKYRAQKMMEQGIKMIQDKKGYRRVVPSPVPEKIIEEDIIKDLIREGIIVIAAGGGGIPVIQKNGLLAGIEAVIDKDLTGSLMASVIGAEAFLILTDVEKVALNYGKDNQIDLDEITTSEAQRYVEEGHFGKGSMEPKVLSAIRFIRSGGKIAIISNLDKAVPAIECRAGTRIIP
ncbi:carbamate kinase [Candidatus Methanoperedens nitroreducens]|uniref:Carbamate kinase n=1 Tax=Candidatus Methanoperedens nitratireducens TaxID=1392998 RepID=A0A062V2S6_9EURY|nr:carbamate kinase [Candidatus Methanoperedens nitroreducens]KCZ70893.1 carbamate kinase [Candidatus Methanoperedens nitroreducens]MDJ1421739.1 carbamate kinase [Candidatus Methanoperedens sp.]